MSNTDEIVDYIMMREAKDRQIANLERQLTEKDATIASLREGLRKLHDASLPITECEILQAEEGEMSRWLCAIDEAKELIGEGK
jgi:aminoglycoside phosphotransferase